MTELGRRHSAALLLVLVACSVLVYSGTSEHELLNWDDRSYVTNNPWVTNPNPTNIAAMFTGSRMANWHPLTWLSYVPEYAMCGKNASCYKFNNALLHGLNGFLVAILVMLVAKHLGATSSVALQASSRRWPQLSVPVLAGVIAAFLFVVHPQHVESVTWIAERKDLLCALFYFAALIVYLQADRSSYLQTYGWCLLLFVLALMSKSMAVSLPVSLMLIDVCLRLQTPSKIGINGAIRVLVVEKLPFILITLAAVVVTLSTQSAGDYEPVDLVRRVTLVVAGIEHYVLSLLLPVGLSPFYPAAIASMRFSGMLIVVILVAALALSLYRLGDSRIARAGALVLLFFLVTLAPVSGIVPVGEHAFADRYTYIPMFGFYGVVGYLLARVQERWSKNPLPLLLPALGCLLLALQSANYKHTWQDDLSFWSAIVDSYPEQAAMPIDNLANAHAVAGDYEQAISLYRRSIAIEAGQAMSYINLAGIYEFTGDADSAVEVLQAGLAANPESAALLSRSGRTLVQAGRLEEAQAQLAQALAIDPDLPDTLLSVGMLYQRVGRLDEALRMLADVPLNVPQHYQANLHILEILLAQQSEFADEQLAEMIAVYGETPQLLQARQLLEARTN